MSEVLLPISRLGRRSLAAVAALIAAACSPVRLLNSAAPDRLAASDLAYGSNPRQRLDVYTPPPGKGPAPVVLFIYGGNWQTGDRGMYRFAGAALAAAGCVTVIADYRLYPEARFPDFLRDCAAATRWTRDNAARFGGDPDRMFLMGHSAGAYNVAMLALDKQWLGAVGLEPRRDLRGVIGVAGPYDFLPLEDPVLVEIFGGNGPAIAHTQPINFVDGTNPPTLLLAGDADTTVLPRNTTRLAARIREHGGPIQSRLYSGIGHAPIIGALAAPVRFIAPTLQDTVAFMAAPPTS
jgi:acetyl esterase/lipase